MSISESRSETVLLLSFTDQFDWGFSKKFDIFLNCSTDVDDAWSGTLHKIFQNVIKFDLYKSANAHGLIETNIQILNIAKIYTPKYVFYPCNFSSIVTEETLFELRKTGSRIIVDYFDDDILFKEFSKWQSNVDFVVTHVASLVPEYQKIGIRALLTAAIPMNTSYFRKIDLNKIYNVTFLGSLYDHRKKIIKELEINGVKVEYFGGGNEKKLHISEMVKVFNNSKIVLNLTTGKENREIIQGRVFETTLSGSFLLTEYIPGIEKWFEIGNEIVCFYNVDDAVEKINYYLQNDIERERIALNGYKKAHQNYTGPIILEDVIKFVEKDILLNVKEVIKDYNLSINSFKIHNANEYFKWTKAMLSLNDYRRKGWLETCKLTFRNNPNHKGAKILLIKYNIFGDPKPLSLFLKSIVKFVKIFYNKLLLYIKYLLKKNK